MLSTLRSLKRPIKKFVARKLNQRGYYDIRGLGYEICTIDEFRRRARSIMERFDQQDETTVAALRKKYEQPIIGEVPVYRLLELQAQIIDPANCYLYCTSQLIHTLQVVESMERAGVADRELIATTLIHDLGKLAFLKGELPEHVEGGGKRPLRVHEKGIGLDNCSFTWDHSDIVHARFKPYVSENMAWLLRYHSITPACFPLMDERDRMLFEKYYKTFVAHDRTFIFYHLPAHRLEKYRDMLEEFFPKTVLFSVAAIWSSALAAL
jgi:hypothetical protein